MSLQNLNEMETDKNSKEKVDLTELRVRGQRLSMQIYYDIDRMANAYYFEGNIYNSLIINLSKDSRDLIKQNNLAVDHAIIGLEVQAMQVLESLLDKCVLSKSRPSTNTICNLANLYRKAGLLPKLTQLFEKFEFRLPIYRVQLIKDLFDLQNCREVSVNRKFGIIGDFDKSKILGIDILIAFLQNDQTLYNLLIDNFLKLDRQDSETISNLLKLPLIAEQRVQLLELFDSITKVQFLYSADTCTGVILKVDHSNFDGIILGQTFFSFHDFVYFNQSEINGNLTTGDIVSFKIRYVLKYNRIRTEAFSIVKVNKIPERVLEGQMLARNELYLKRFKEINNVGIHQISLFQYEIRNLNKNQIGIFHGLINNTSNILLAEEIKINEKYIEIFYPIRFYLDYKILYGSLSEESISILETNSYLFIEISIVYFDEDNFKILEVTNLIDHRNRYITKWYNDKASMKRKTYKNDNNIENYESIIMKSLMNGDAEKFGI